MDNGSPQPDALESHIRTAFVEALEAASSEYRGNVAAERESIVDYRHRHMPDTPVEEVGDYYKGEARKLATESVADLSASRDQTLSKLGDLQSKAVKKEKELRDAERIAERDAKEVPEFRKKYLLGLPWYQWPWVTVLLLGAVLYVETEHANAPLFAKNLLGGQTAGQRLALWISVVNVIALGFLLAAFYRMSRRAAPAKKLTGWFGLATFAAVALCWNLLVGHYRGALSNEYPSEGNPPGNTCYTADQTEITAQSEAVCLFLHSPFRLDGFESYLLMTIGLIACAFAAYKFFWLFFDPYLKVRKWQKRHDDALKALVESITEERGKAAEKEVAFRNTFTSNCKSHFGDAIAQHHAASIVAARIDDHQRAYLDQVDRHQNEFKEKIRLYRRSRGINGEVWTDADQLVWKQPEPPELADPGTRAVALERHKQQLEAIEAQMQEFSGRVSDLRAEIDAFLPN